MTMTNMVRMLPTARTASGRPYSRFHNSLLQSRSITTATAKSMLGFTENCQFTVRELRHAYFEAAKLHHPDVLKQRQDKTTIHDFRDITTAYEYLLQSPHITKLSQEEIITHDEEAEYRSACLDILGIPAEIVEESKKNPMFRQWLQGKTDAAMHWKMFLSKYGGLAEKLRPRVQVTEGERGPVKKVDTRRKRRR